MKKKILFCLLALAIALPLPLVMVGCKDKPTTPPQDPPGIINPENPSETPKEPEENPDNNPSETPEEPEEPSEPENPEDPNNPSNPENPNPENPEEPPVVNAFNEQAKQTLSQWVNNDLFPFDLVDVVSIDESTQTSFSFSFTSDDVAEFKFTLFENLQIDKTFSMENANKYVRIDPNGKTIIELTEGDVLIFSIHTEEIEFETEAFLNWMSFTVGIPLEDFPEDAKVFDLALEDNEAHCKILGNAEEIFEVISIAFLGEGKPDETNLEIDLFGSGIITMSKQSGYVSFDCLLY